jgi:hypothetical protein
MSLESSWNLDVWNEFAWPIWTPKTQVMAKRRVGSRIGNLTPDRKKSRIISISLRIGGMPHIVGKLSTRATTLFWTSSQLKVYRESYGPPKLRESQVWEFQDSHLGVSKQNVICMMVPWPTTKYTIRGRWWLPPSLSRDNSYESEFARGLS